MVWIALTLTATVLQTFRNSFAKQLSEQVSPLTVSLCRFLYGLPVSAVALFVAWQLFGSVHTASPLFYLSILVFSVAQISANALLISLFRYKNFAVSVTYSKTEGVFTALLAVVFLSEQLPTLGWIGVWVAFVGLLFASFAKKRVAFSSILSSLFEGSTLLGFASGVLFAVATVSVKTAFRFVEADDPFLKPVFALFVAQVMQVALLIPFLLLRKPYELKHIFQQPRNPIAIGVFSGLGSFCWFVAFSIAFVGYVKTLGQIEFVLSVLISVFYFKEKIQRNEFLGMLLIVVGTLLLVYA